MAYDSRAVANSILHYTLERGINCSNLKLQKLLFFVHGTWVTRYGEPLCEGAFEAWTHGPVHPVVYEAFCEFGANNITSFAESLNLITRERKEIPRLSNLKVNDVIANVVSNLGHLSGSQLRNITHAKGAPWSIVIASSQHSANIGLKITDDVIRSTFSKQLYLVGGGPEEEEIYENSPYSGN